MPHNLHSKIKAFCDYLNGKYQADVRLYLANNGDLKLDNIRVPKEKRKKGIGSAIMDEIVSFADENRLRVVLTTATKDPYVGTTSTGRLEKFYKRFDFVENKGKDYSISENMLSMPKQTMNALNKANKLDELGYYKEADLINVHLVNFLKFSQTNRNYLSEANIDPQSKTFYDAYVSKFQTWEPNISNRINVLMGSTPNSEIKQTPSSAESVNYSNQNKPLVQNKPLTFKGIKSSSTIKKTINKKAQVQYNQTKEEEIQTKIQSIIDNNLQPLWTKTLTSYQECKNFAGNPVKQGETVFYAKQFTDLSENFYNTCMSLIKKFNSVLSPASLLSLKQAMFGSPLKQINEIKNICKNVSDYSMGLFTGHFAGEVNPNLLQERLLALNQKMTSV